MDFVGVACRDCAAVAGACMVVYGLKTCCPPAAWIAGGVLIIFAAVSWSRAQETVGGDERGQESEVNDAGDT